LLQVQLVRFDQSEIDGVFSIDVYIDALKFSENELAEFVIERLEVLNKNV